MVDLPSSTPLLSSVIFDDTLSAALFRSYSRLYAAAWRNNYTQTDPMDFEQELVPLLSVSRASARDHLRMLRIAKLLWWTSNGNHKYTIYFSQINDESESRNLDSIPSPANWTLGGGGESINSLDNDSTPPPESRKLDSRSGNPDLEEIATILTATRELFGEQVLGPPSRYDRCELLAMIAQVYYEQAADYPARVVYRRLADGIQPDPDYLADPLARLPAKFLQAAGIEIPENHRDPAPDEKERSRYISGRFADYIEH